MTSIYSGPEVQHVLRTWLNSFSCGKVCFIKNYCGISSHLNGKTHKRYVESDSGGGTDAFSLSLSPRASKWETREALLRHLKRLLTAHTGLYRMRLSLPTQNVSQRASCLLQQKPRTGRSLLCGLDCESQALDPEACLGLAPLPNP